MKKTLDTKGQVCPFPLEEAITAVNEINSGDELEIIFDCTQATESIPQWAVTEGLEITLFEQIDDAIWSITLQK
ncbi:MAG TPA: sulfurtransferase TusA family protein [Bacillota bacterium]|nr:sulfurtransferase TusA family protein [Bacillota bacterium]